MFLYTYDAFLKIVLFVNNKHEPRALIWFFTAVRWLDTSYNVAYTAVVVSIPRMLYDPLVSSGWRAKTPPLSDFLVTFALM